ncbi:hypothetical protein MCOR34_005852 [Pyricularia oryzae]|nr:hypothetical protein MCOR34_005852 [Pyricularia oryzae]KAI6499869.1 hypothetical protein MCOR13_006136 [Pyricularia oryzae]KAI6579948.1 hypothetical protein MCOR04_005861 [Pyricularia oryzae]KAI6594607.1 hypothetical protein MCOR06_003246 [Pyricularia oryzae]
MVMAGLALMVVDDKKFRSRTMDFEVEQAINLHFFRKSKDKQFNTCIAQVFVLSIGTNTIGYQLKAENRTLIVARMRGGEPIARGEYQALPQAIYALAKTPDQYLIVDIGKSMVVCVEHNRDINPQAKILLVAGVVQAGAMAVGKEESLRRKMKSWEDVSNVALRVSENKYTGVKGTDTGDRLFNITHWALE